MSTTNPQGRTEFDVGDAIGAPLRLPSGRGFLVRLALWTAALLLVIWALLGQDLIVAYGDLLVYAAEIDKNGLPEDDPEAALALLSGFSGTWLKMLLMFILSWVVFASAEAAFHKNIFRGTDMGVFPLRFGTDEVRVMLAQLVVGLCVMAVYIGGVMALILLTVVAGASATISSVLAVILGIAVFAAFIYWLVKLIQVMIRLAPAAAMSIRDNTQRTTEGWAAVKGRTWPMFGSYVIVYIVGYVVMQIVLALGLYLAFGNGDVWSLFLGMSVDEPREVLNAAKEMMSSGRVKIVLALGLALYVFATVVFQAFMWGVGNYAAQIDGRDKGLL